MPWYKRLYDWLERRVQLEGPVKETALHMVPRKTASWWYVFGSAALTLLMLQVVTGVLLALVYVPSAAEAWNSLQLLNHHIALGWLLRAIHGWGSNFMVAVVLVHMAQVFLFGAYKFPRELTWMVGIFLLLMTLGMAFTGQVLRFDQDAYWGIGIGVSISGRVPFVGSQIVHLLLGGPIIGGATLSRFFALHVFIIPGLLLALAGLHLWMVLKLGINEWPMPGRLVRRDTYIAEYNELAHKDGIPFFPGAIWKDLIFSASIIGAVLCCAIVFGPFGPSGMPDPTMIDTVPKPDFFFLWLYALLSLLPPNWETPFLLIAPPIAIAILLLLPLVAGTGEKSWHRRPVAVLTLLVLAVGWATLTRLATYAPWSPQMSAWSGAPIPVHFIRNTTPLIRQGANVFQYKQCRNCHALGGLGGDRGPALDDVAARMTHDQLIRQVIQGGGNMPAFGTSLSPAEVTALVQFLETLHPPNQQRARDVSRGLAESGERPRQGDVGTGFEVLMQYTAPDPEQLWDVPIFATSVILLTTVIYLRGFRLARRMRPRELPLWRCWAFLAGMTFLFLALASPVDTYAAQLLLAHMTQHFLLMSVVPPLLALGAPIVPMLRGVPRWFVIRVIGPVLRTQAITAALRVLRSPAFGWFAMNLAYVGWHLPPAYELALRSESWHNCEHLCFLLTSLLFWWNVLQPWPARNRLSRWAVVPYLLTADLVNTAVSAYLCFSGRLLYPSYASEPKLFDMTPLTDQIAAGAEMWVLGSLIFLIPLTLISFRMLSGKITPGAITPHLAQRL